ncbi:hypothetical protein PPYR_07746 [Photinus pyralis]|uniref:Uncharacterized protein n=1 Tax=Photinus pyralis TaxID=7054 RepID=A0A5N4ARD7_PHOPY|nr:hypothetical protein PPYR_07746 [Photinus pyralis]
MGAAYLHFSEVSCGTVNICQDFSSSSTALSENDDRSALGGLGSLRMRVWLKLSGVLLAHQTYVFEWFLYLYVSKGFEIGELKQPKFPRAKSRELQLLILGENVRSKSCRV